LITGFHFDFFFLLPKSTTKHCKRKKKSGEGSFIVNNRGDLAFVITQATIDKQVLEFIQEILGFGKVIPPSAITSRYITQNKKEIDILVSLFNGNLVLPKRQETFDLFLFNQKETFDLFVKGFNK